MKIQKKIFFFFWGGVVSGEGEGRVVGLGVSGGVNEKLKFL